MLEGAGSLARAAAETLRWLRGDPLERMDRLFAARGDIFVSCLLGPRFDESSWSSLEAKRAIFGRSASFAKAAFALDGAALHAGAANAYLTPFLGRDSLFTVDGPAHERERSAAARCIRMQREPLDGFIQASFSRHLALAGASARDRPDYLDICHAVTCDVAMNFAFAGRTVLDDRIRDAVRYLSERVRPRHLFFPWLQALPAFAPPFASIRSTRGLLRAAVTAAVSGSMLVAEGEQADLTRLVDRVITLLFGAYESTATAAAWTIYELLQDDALMADLSHLCRTDSTADAAEAERLLLAAALEALRLHPVVPIVTRRASQSCRLGDIDVRTGDYVVISIYCLQRSAKHYAQANRFDAHRFGSMHPDAEAFRPFGGGIRHCIGQGMALRMLPLLLRHSLRTASYAYGAPRKIGTRNITCVPERMMPVTPLMS